MTTPNTTTANDSATPAKKPGRQKLVVNQEVVNNRFTNFANAVSEVMTGQEMIATTRVAIANLPSDKQKKIIQMLAGGIGAANETAWKEFGFLMSRMFTKLSRKAPDSVISATQYDAMEKLLPIILELCGSGSDEVEDDEVSE